MVQYLCSNQTYIIYFSISILVFFCDFEILITLPYAFVLHSLQPSVTLKFLFHQTTTENHLFHLNCQPAALSSSIHLLAGISSETLFVLSSFSFFGSLQLVKFLLKNYNEDPFFVVITLL